MAGGASALTALATVATPLLAAAVGWSRGWRWPLVPAPVVAALYVLAWLWPQTLAGQAAGVALIAGACLTATALVAALAPEGWLAAGLVLLVCVDCALVWGDRQVGPTMNSLSAARPPVALGRSLPSLQQVEFGSVTMGWLDLAAPALLGLIVQRRTRAAVATGAAAGAWGLLLTVTSPIAATPPVLAGLLAGGRLRPAPRLTSRVAPTSVPRHERRFAKVKGRSRDDDSSRPPRTAGDARSDHGSLLGAQSTKTS
jgi:hypothetical protein